MLKELKESMEKHQEQIWTGKEKKSANLKIGQPTEIIQFQEQQKEEWREETSAYGTCKCNHAYQHIPRESRRKGGREIGIGNIWKNNIQNIPIWWIYTFKRLKKLQEE